MMTMNLQLMNEKGEQTWQGKLPVICVEESAVHDGFLFVKMQDCTGFYVAQDGSSRSVNAKYIDCANPTQVDNCEYSKEGYCTLQEGTMVRDMCHATYQNLLQETGND